MRTCLLFNISNAKDSYARCLNVIMKSERGDPITAQDIPPDGILFTELKESASKPLRDREVIAVLEEEWNRRRKDYCQEAIDRLESVWNWNQVEFWFFVTNAREEDIVNFQYFALIRQRYRQCRLYIKSEEPELCGKITGQASQYLQYVTRSEKKTFCYGLTLKEKKYTVMPLNKYPIGILRNFSPLIEIVSNERTLQDWQMSVEDLLNRAKTIPQIDEWSQHFPIMRVQNVLNNEIRKHKEQELALKKIKEKQFNLSRIEWSYQILYLCMEYFCTMDEHKNVLYEQKRHRVFYGEEFYNTVKDMPVLAFYIMCMYDYMLKQESKATEASEYDYKLLMRQALNARDMADGILQLIENVHHSEHKEGFFCFRVHMDSLNEPKRYLTDTYGNYIKNRRKGTSIEKSFYLETHVVDFSSLTVASQFAANVRKRLAGVGSEELLEAAEKLCLKSFFYPTDSETEFWDEYNQIGENVVHHYGLQVFESLVRSNEGCFYAVSSPDIQVLDDRYRYSNQDIADRKEEWHIPGTQFAILLPFIHENIPLNTVINADIDYTEFIEKSYKVIHNINFDEESFLNYEQGLQYSGSYQEFKERLIGRMEVDFDGRMGEEKKTLGENETPILHYDAKRVSLCRIELFCKVIMLYLSKYKRENAGSFYMSITNCSRNHFLEITRMFAVFYNKQGNNSLMRDVQIYLSGEKPCEEFLLSGENIGVAVSRAEKLSFSRGVHPQCLKIMNEVLKKRSFEVVDSGRLKIVPFDLQNYGEEGDKNLFEQGVEAVLCSDIMHYEFGCRLYPTHIRIGSKVHISTFYEAELLFHNNYYIARFAYILAKRILNSSIDWSRKLILVGYETYSEMLLYELKQYLEHGEKNADVEYVIYEQRGEGHFRYLRAQDSYEDAQFILIVAINSTLTTHNKLRASLKKTLEKNSKKQCILDVKGNFALILVRSNPTGALKVDEMEEQYWSDIGSHVIKTELISKEDPDVVYLVSVIAKWLNPLKCPLCFPKDSMLEEKPLIETNKASIVPMQMVGINEKADLDLLEPVNRKEGVTEEENCKRVKLLKSSLVYRHVIRKGNHFIFYLQTENYFAENKEIIIEWLKKIKLEAEREKTRIYYDILIAPLHFSNTGFLDEVNHYVFHNAALVLHFDVEKEFRDNVRTKYSNLLALYQNLYRAGKHAEINFHFIDDTIISGDAYFRAKSLIKGLFPQIQSEGIRVNVFSSIILLVSRMSESTIYNYIDDPARFFCFTKLRISSMRNHEDACTLCKTGKNAEELRKQSSTNQLCEYYDLKIVKYRPISVEEDRALYQADSVRQERAYRRMLCSHIANTQMDRLGYRKNDTDEVFRLMVQLLTQESDDPFEYLLSYIKVWSRPFLGFRKSTKEAIFDIMLRLIEFLLSDSDFEKLEQKYPGKYRPLKKACEILEPFKSNRQDRENSDKLMALLLTLMKRLSELGSNYVIRKRNIRKIFKFVGELSLDEQKKAEFEKRYLALVKRICSLSSDENKSVYLEYLLLFDQEYIERKDETIIPPLSPFELSGYQSFVNTMFFENTRVLTNAIANLARALDAEQSEAAVYLETAEGRHSIENLIGTEYYYDSFKQILTYYGMFRSNGADPKAKKYELTDRGKNCIKGMVSMYKLLTHGDALKKEKDKKKDIEEYYDRFLQFALEITGAESIQIMFPDHSSEETKYYVKETGKCICEGEKLIEQCSFVSDTFCIKKREDGIWRSFIQYRNYVGDKYSGISCNDIGQIYMMIEFPAHIFDVEVYIGIKLMMLFRELVVQEFENDFGSNLMQKWISEQYFKSQMLKARAGDHTDKDDLQGILERITECSGEEMTESENSLYRDLFKLVINTYIARINLQLLAGEAPYTENNRDRFCFVYGSQLKALIQAVKRLDGVEMCDRDGTVLENDFDDEVMRSVIRMRGKVRPTVKRLSIIITELVRSVPRHGKTKKVYTYREGKFLVVKNEDNTTVSLENCNEQVNESLRRRRGGISLAVTKEFVNRFYDLREEDGVKVMVESDQNGNKYFVVKLPIFEEGEKR